MDVSWRGCCLEYTKSYLSPTPHKPGMVEHTSIPNALEKKRQKHPKFKMREASVTVKASAESSKILFTKYEVVKTRKID